MGSKKRSLCQAAIELGNVVFAQEAIRVCDGGDFMQAEFLRQTSLPGADILSIHVSNEVAAKFGSGFD